MKAISLATHGYILKPCPVEGPVVDVVVIVEDEDIETTVFLEDELEVSVVVCE